MNELEQLLGMDLPTDVKELLNTVKANTSELTKANEAFTELVKTKDRANLEISNDRKELRSQIKILEDAGVKTDDKSVQEKIDKINLDWSEKFKAKDNELNTIKTDMLNKSKFDDFNELQIKLDPSMNEARTAYEMNNIKNAVMQGREYDEDSKSWVYKNDGVVDINPLTAKPITLQERYTNLTGSGVFDGVLFDGEANSGGGRAPNSSNGTPSAKTMPRSQFEGLQASAQASFMSDGGQLQD